MAVAKNGKGVQAIQIRQVVIQQHQIEIVVVLCEFESLSAVATLQNFHVFVEPFEHLAKAFSHQRVIVHY